MKLLHRDSRIIGTATDEYVGDELVADVPEGFDFERIGEYRILDGNLVIPPAPIPVSVTMRQARLALLDDGLLDSVATALAAIPDPVQRKVAQIEWEFSPTVSRGARWWADLSVALGMGEAELDAFFAKAATL